MLFDGGTAVEREIDKRASSLAEAVGKRVDTDRLIPAVVPRHAPILVYPPRCLCGETVQRWSYIWVLVKCHIGMGTKEQKEGTHHETENG